MRLKNKKTGEIGEIGYISTTTGDILVSNINDQDEWYHYNSLAALNAEWEDYDGTKDGWCLSYIGGAKQCREYATDTDVELCKAIGNYFSSREEAEQAVERLKAFKRLKGKGFRFIDNKIIGEYGNVSYRLNYPATAVEEKDLDICFGGEE